MAVAGIFASDMSWNGDRRTDFAGAILHTVASGDAPLFALSAGTRDIRAQDTYIRWLEQSEVSGRVRIAQPPAAPSGNTFVLQDTSMIARGTIMIVEQTGEQLFVVGVTGHSVTVIRGWAGTLIQPILAINPNNQYTQGTNANYVKIITRAFEEGSDPPPGYVYNPAPRHNLTQIFRSTAEATGTATAVSYNSGPVMQRTTAEAMNDHAVQIEGALMLGRRSESVQNGKPLRTMNGLFEHILTNRFTIPVTGLSYTMMNTLTEVVHQRKVRGMPHERIFFGGNRALTVMNTLAKAHSLRYVDENTRLFGLQINSWISPHGEIKLITHPKFNSDPLLAGCMVGYHPGLFNRRTLRPTRRITGNYIAGRDTEATYYITEMACQYRAEDTGTLINGLFNADTRDCQHHH